MSVVTRQIPGELRERVFVLGVFSEPEHFRNVTHKNFEAIGETLAKDCSDNTYELWRHALLKHNETELERITVSVKPFLFD